MNFLSYCGLSYELEIDKPTSNYRRARRLQVKKIPIIQGMKLSRKRLSVCQDLNGRNKFVIRRLGLGWAGEEYY